jgi:hypothetical protein
LLGNFPLGNNIRVIRIWRIQWLTRNISKMV